MKLNAKIYYSIIAIAFVVFVAYVIRGNQKPKDNWNQTEIFGQIQDIALKKNDKGIYMNINNNWYGFSYDRIFEEKSFKKYYLIKHRGEEVYWLKKTPTSTDSISFWSGSSFIVTKRGDINLIEKGILNWDLEK
jgi:hypothetical protein